MGIFWIRLELSGNSVILSGNMWRWDFLGNFSLLVSFNILSPSISVTVYPTISIDLCKVFPGMKFRQNANFCKVSPLSLFFAKMCQYYMEKSYLMEVFVWKNHRVLILMCEDNDGEPLRTLNLVSLKIT